jgi:hypothetical protein
MIWRLAWRNGEANMLSAAAPELFAVSIAPAISRLLQYHNLDPAATRSVLQCLELLRRGATGVGQHCHALRAGQHFREDFLPLAVKLCGDDAEARHIALRLGERGYEIRSDHTRKITLDLD